MRLTPLNVLVPGVVEIERLVFEVKSETVKGKTYRVDFERKHGLGLCDCADCRCRKNLDCKHITKVRKYLAAKVAQEVIKQNAERF